MSKDKERILPIDIEEEMRKSYLDYAMTVIVSRALPDVRDGLKPVHRRILYAMNELGLTPDKPHRKSARIVGDVLGKYHPHGDSAVYDAMVRLAQDFSTRYQLVDGHGNFGSIDGDGAAAMRYTEARMAKITTELLRDINKETVNYRPNFDETLKEPVVLPSKFPNLLVNGSSGIAVGMASSIPPHNLGEVIDGAVELIDNPDADIETIMKHIKGPDFPTGATIMGIDNIKSAYKTGRGRVKVRAKTTIEQVNKSKYRIIVTELPYQVNKARLIEKIANLVRDKKIEGISDLRDESDRNGMRIVIELKRDVNPNIVLNNLYKYTQLQDTFSIIMIALVNGEPKVLNLRQMLKYYLEHQKEVITRRTQYDLNKAEARAHILEGLKIALDNIDAVISLIRKSKSVKEAKEGLMNNFKLTDKQAQAILDMRLQKLTGLEREKIEEEYENLIKLINKYREILANERLIYQIVKEELLEIKEKYNDERRTEIVPEADEIDIEDMIEEQRVAITLTHFGYIKRMPEDTYKLQKRGGKGVIGITTREEDFVEHLFITSTHDYLLFFTNAGKVYRMKAYEIPEARRQSKGTAIVNLLQLEPNEKITAVIPINEFNKKSYLVLLTKHGTIKKTQLDKFDTSRKNGLIAINLKEDDELISVKRTTGENDLIIVTAHGMAIRFNEGDVREMGRTAMGVKAITLNKGDSIVDMSLVEEGDDLLVVSEKGYGKRTSLDEYRTQTRAGKGIKTYNIKSRTGNISAAKVVKEDDEVMLISQAGSIIRLRVSGVSKMGRSTSGVTLMRLDKEDKVVSIAKVVAEEEE
ncbi:DNA gyrase subunit A [Caldisalinibacter kiritimatiensis]|uniref:DNA gyrase subunit A n=1 Tax=Caldisalinibacter kiritimatiensis TaxID=1304284 RepID=R1CAV0_9FIRM|nr:DNA gyrase subunit A [Caldisalinibacter kiritimatiensis]EOC99439.1 DNA gyrase subunit A [Caldisalinibacter kiritimatiensis]